LLYVKFRLAASQYSPQSAAPQLPIDPPENSDNRQ
jgi:hypothetical protein